MTKKTNEASETTSPLQRLYDELDALQSENRDLRNELCLKCGSYREAYLGACDGCRWKAV